jgi:hypothetical protein
MRQCQYALGCCTDLVKMEDTLPPLRQTLQPQRQRNASSCRCLRTGDTGHHKDPRVEIAPSRFIWPASIATCWQCRLVGILVLLRHLGRIARLPASTEVAVALWQNAYLRRQDNSSRLCDPGIRARVRAPNISTYRSVPLICLICRFGFIKSPILTSAAQENTSHSSIMTDTWSRCHLINIHIHTA